MSRSDASSLAARLGRQAEAVCRHYLSRGVRRGRYWIVGDVRNSPGRSMFVRLHGPESGQGAAGKWSDAATGEHGDLLDVIRETSGLTTFADVTQEARRFLDLPPPFIGGEPPLPRSPPRRPREAARRLFGASRPIGRTLAESYLRRRGIANLRDMTALRFHPRCHHRRESDARPEVWPAMIAAVTDLHGHLTGVHRTWLDPRGFSEATLGKAPLADPRRALGDLAGSAVRFGEGGPVMAAGEGIETVLSLRTLLPAMPMVAALSAAQLATLRLPPRLLRLYIARDDDPAGRGAVRTLGEWAERAGIEAIGLSPALDDFNADLRILGADALRESLRDQLHPEDVVTFMSASD